MAKPTSREPRQPKPEPGATGAPPDDTNAGLRARLDALKADLGEAIAEDAHQSPKGGDAAMGSAVGVGLRMGSELVAGTLVGGVIGYFLDQAFNTTPLFLIAFVLIGMLAGFWNIYRLGMRPTGSDKPEA